MTLVVRSWRDARRRKNMKTQSKIVDGMDFGSKVMPQAKVDALIKEFPFIKNLLINVQVLKIPLSQIYVTVAEEKILSYSPVHHCEQDIPFFELSFFFEKMIFLGKHGERVKINLQIPKKRKYLLFGPRKIQTMPFTYFWSGWGNKTVEDQIKIQLNEVHRDSVYYILSYYSYTRAVILYKFPERKSLGAWLRFLKDK